MGIEDVQVEMYMNWPGNRRLGVECFETELTLHRSIAFIAYLKAKVVKLRWIDG